MFPHMHVRGLTVFISSAEPDSSFLTSLAARSVLARIADDPLETLGQATSARGVRQRDAGKLNTDRSARFQRTPFRDSLTAQVSVRYAPSSLTSLRLWLLKNGECAERGTPARRRARLMRQRTAYL